MTTQLEWLTVAQAADYLQVTRGTLYRWSRQGRLTIHKFGVGASRLRKSELENLAASSRDAIVTVVGTDRWAVYELGTEIHDVEDAVSRFTGSPVDFQQRYEAFLNQSPCRSWDTQLKHGDLLVLIARGSSEVRVDDRLDADWLRIAESTFEMDWNNPRDAIYDDWKGLYGIRDR